MINLRFRSYHPRTKCNDYWIMKSGTKVGLVEHDILTDCTIVKWYVYRPLDAYDEVHVRSMNFSSFRDAWKTISSSLAVWYDKNGRVIKSEQ